MAETCAICEKIVENDRKEGLQGLVKVNLARKDGKEGSFRGEGSCLCCQKQYTRPQAIKADLKKASLPSSTSQASGCANRPLRSNQLVFIFQTKWFFRTENIDKEFHKKTEKITFFYVERFTQYVLQIWKNLY